jgi:hypothetical protein
MSEETFPAVPTRIVEPVVSPETAVPTSAVECVECTVSGNEALAATTRRNRKAAAPDPQTDRDDSDPTPQGAD